MTIKGIITFIGKAVSSLVGGMGVKITSAAVSAAVFCGSVFGGFTDVGAAKEVVPAASGEASLSRAYYAYIDLLKSEKESIDKYSWQKGET